MFGTLAAMFHQDIFVPAAVALRDPLKDANDAEARMAGQGDRDLVLGKNRGLQPPEASFLRGPDPRFEQRPPDAAPSRFRPTYTLTSATPR